MTEFKRGALAGVFSGVVLGIVLFLVPPWGWESLAGALMHLVRSIISKGFAGVVYALMFLIIYDYLPAEKLWLNGILYSVILWLVFYVSMTATLGWFDSVTSYLIFITINLLPMILYGYLLGLIYGRLEEKRKQELDEFMKKVRS